MTINESSTAAEAITAATVQGLHAFMASEAKAAATDTQLEAAAKPFGAGPTQTRMNEDRCCHSNPKSLLQGRTT